MMQTPSARAATQNSLTKADAAWWANFPASPLLYSNTPHLIAHGEAIPPALHAAALEPQRFASLELTSELVPWDTVARTPLIQNQFVTAVWSALKEYDLPDLQRAYESQLLR